MTLNNKEGIKQRSWTAIMALVSKSVSKSVLLKCKIKGEKKVWITLFFRIKKTGVVWYIWEQRGGGITARVKTNKAFLDRNRCYLKRIHWAERSDCLLRVMRNIISGLAVPMTATSGTGCITGGASDKVDDGNSYASGILDKRCFHWHWYSYLQSTFLLVSAR